MFENEILNEIFDYQKEIFSSYKNKNYKRYFFNQVFNTSSKLTGIIGARGVGKTTALIQYLNEYPASFSKKLYISADFIMIDSLFEIVKAFVKEGGEVVVIDEIHKYSNFEIELKKIYDILNIKVFFSGSSAIKLDNAKADLSRRAVIFEVRGLSFREFLEMDLKKTLPTFSLEDILKNHTDIAYELLDKFLLKPKFKEYIQKGYYPFYFDDKENYLKKLNEVVNTSIEVDIPSVFPIEYETVTKLKKIVRLICESYPFTLNMQEFLAKMQMSKNDYKRLYNYFYYLQKSKILRLLWSKYRGNDILTKPEKIYLNNTNLHYAYCSTREIGTVREVFFASMLENYKLQVAKKGDFTVNGYTFEIGGKNKTKKQIKNIENAFIVKDDIEIGSKNVIPLWLFGFLY
ncbi:ATP-binding protein [Nitrosophilus labii]|uniref:ATP-binding protein n=1 Tax=Nitrosophilus labii TaxID=2706014 RepID=UPI00165748F3|nr:AAA family ATPase [Nitrosophilus labii]